MLDKIYEIYFKFLIVFISKYFPFLTNDIKLSQYLNMIFIRNNIVTINKTMHSLKKKGTTLKLLYSFVLSTSLINVLISISPAKLPPNKTYNNIKVMTHEIVINEIDINFDIF